MLKILEIWVDVFSSEFRAYPCFKAANLILLAFSNLHIVG
ncbi:MAG: hypothetical protein ACI9W6_001282 [Motiliproteus sp.]|jgi:hypothetical protein